jgi:hypothetical protein
MRFLEMQASVGALFDADWERGIDVPKPTDHMDCLWMCAAAPPRALLRW